MADILNTYGTGLEAFWELEEASGTRSDSYASYDLSDGNTVGQTTGVQGNAASFVEANQEYLNRSSADELNITANNDKTIAFWINGTKTGTYAYLFHRWGLGGVKNYLIRANGSGIIEMYLDNGAGGTGELATGTTNVMDGSTHFVVCTFNGSDNKSRIYVDGNATPEGTSAAETPAGGSAPLYIGGDSSTSTFTGWMDHIGIWNHLWDTTAQAAMYNSGSGIPYEDVGGGSAAPAAKRVMILM